VNDDDLSELILRASAYLDGQLDAAETARAEADPAVMAEVGALRELQDSVRDVGPAPDAVREAAIAAALTEFDVLNEAHVPVPPADDEPLHLHRPHAPAVPFRPRPAYTRWLTAAAAVLVIGMLGVVVVNGVGGSDDEEDGGVASPQLDPAATELDNARIAEAEGGVAEESATAEATEISTEESGATEIAAADAAAEAAPATTTAAEAAEESGDVVVAAAPQFPPFDPERPITSVEELGAVGAELLAGEAEGRVVRNVETRCDLTPFEPYQRGLYDDGGGVREVIVAIDPDARQTGAFDADSCTIVAVSPQP
jgi:hypothetical protein